MLKHLMLMLCTLAVIALSPGSEAWGQCILANPSFEIGGTGGALFGGWNQFGSVGSDPSGTHGALAARVTGPSSGSWDMSGYWQPLDSAPGDQWRTSVRVWHGPGNPLSGQSQALVNVEWRDAGDNLISFESYPVATASTPVGVVQEFTVTTPPAPNGTAHARILVGVLQSPTDPRPTVYYDEIRFECMGPPTPEDTQWNDFPTGRIVGFAGRPWRVKGPGYLGPGPNLFCPSPSCVWVDGDGRMHLTVKNIAGNWYSSEVALQDALGYGDYIFTTMGRPDLLHHNIVFGLFIWEYGPCYDPANGWWNPYNEIDIELSRWGNPGNDVGQFVAQPWDWPGNINRFPVTFGEDEITSHAFRWLPDRVEYRSWRGGPQDEAPGTLIHSWTYTGPHIPRPEQPRVHINLWQIGTPSSDQEVILDTFTFVSADSSTVGLPLEDPAAVNSHLRAARPNPFTQHTSIGYSLEAAGSASIAVFDAQGRLIRSLVHADLPSGYHETVWDGRNHVGAPVASGVYYYQLRIGDVVETKRMVLMR